MPATPLSPVTPPLVSDRVAKLLERRTIELTMWFEAMPEEERPDALAMLLAAMCISEDSPSGVLARVTELVNDHLSRHAADYPVPS